jgi:type III secretion protein U
MSDEKTEEPTDKKLEDAREKGQSTKSPDVNAAAGLLAMTVCMAAASAASAEHLRQLFQIVWDHGLQAGSGDEVMALSFELLKEGLWIVLPYLAASVAVGLVVSFAQVGLVISFEPLMPDFDKVNPASGLKKLFSIRSVIDLLKMMAKAIAIGWVAYLIIMGLLSLLIGSSLQSPQMIGELAWRAMLKLMGASVIVFIVIGPVDWGIQKWLFIRDQRMSKDEVKREYKEMEGDPLIKGQRRQLAHELLNSDPKAKVPQANVVVTNPTHYAVALRYVPGETPLPIVLAKGVDAEAARIREIAEAHRVPIVANPPLARALYLVRLDDPIPEPLFEAVAAVLRWVALVGRLAQQVAGPAEPQP